MFGHSTLKTVHFLPSGGFADVDATWQWDPLVSIFSLLSVSSLRSPLSTAGRPPRAAGRPPLRPSPCLGASPAPASLPAPVAGPPSSCIGSSSRVRIVKLPCGLATSMPVDHRSKAPLPFDRLDSAGPDAGGAGEHHYELCARREPAMGEEECRGR